MVAERMRPLHRSRPAQIGLAVVVVAMGALGFVPLFDGPGYESALGAGILLAFVVSISAALAVSGDPAQPFDSLSRGVALGAVFALAAWLTTLAHGLRTGFCDALSGTECFALGPATGALLAGVWGAVAGEIARRRGRRRLWAVLLAIAGPLASILVSVGRFYTSPMIFAYDPFVGYFSGTLYDTLIDFSGLVTYRAGSAATLFAASVLALHLQRDAEGRLRLRGLGRPGLVIAGLLAASASLLANAFGWKLGHWQTSATIAAALGGRTEGERCSVVHPRSMRPADAERFAADCDAHVAVLERWFDAPYLDGGRPGRVTAFVFESSAQKGALMGAADTFIAKPWRREVYVQAAAYPHPVLGHELGHVLAGQFGRGPFRIAGSLGGLLPNPGLIEGVAVAAEPPEGDLLPREWARAMKDLGLLPRLDRLFALGFLGENAGVAYTVSGSFVGWIHDRLGPRVIREWYGGRSLPEAAGASWAELEQRWRDDLDTVTLPPAASAQAKARFDRPAIFGRRCPHVVDGCRAHADRLRNGGDFEGAIAAYEQILTLDPHDDGTRLAIARVQVREGRESDGAAAIARLADDARAPRHLRDRAVEDLADLALAAGRADEATSRYLDLESRTLDEDALRTLDIKIAAAEDPRLRPAVVALLIGKDHRAPDRTLAMELLREMAVTAHEPGDGMPWYLLGRQYFSGGQYDEAQTRLDRALAAPIKVARVRLETLRLRMVIACATGDREGAASFFYQYATHAEVSASRRGAARALVERCTRALAPAVAPGEQAR